MKSAVLLIGAGTVLATTTALAQVAVTQPVPRGNAGQWVDIASASPEQLKKLEGRSVPINYTLTVGPHGRATACTHDGKQAMGKEFGDLTCTQLLRRARFTAAT